MITIISSSSRDNNNSKKVALTYLSILKNRGIDAKLLSLDDYEVYHRNEVFNKMESDFLIAADKFIFVIPEYNGSYPGVLKLMIDNSDIAKCWHHKKVLLTGVSSGRAGNLRGMEHITGCFLHMKMLVHHNRLPLSVIESLIGEEGTVNNPAALNAMNHQIDEFIPF
jgi:NAD(P)H-dependent FMN reductase